MKVASSLVNLIQPMLALGIWPDNYNCELMLINYWNFAKCAKLLEFCPNPIASVYSRWNWDATSLAMKEKYIQLLNTERLCGQYLQEIEKKN